MVVNGDGGSEVIDTALPNPLGRRISSSDPSLSVGEWVESAACHFMPDLASGNVIFGGRFLRGENMEETRLSSCVGPNTLLLLEVRRETHMFSTGGGSKTGATARAGSCGDLRFGRKDIRHNHWCSTNSQWAQDRNEGQGTPCYGFGCDILKTLRCPVGVAEFVTVGNGS